MSKNETKSNVSYSGTVKIKVLNGTKVVKSGKAHNSGTQWLFQVLASSILGNDERTNMPHYLSIFEVDDGVETELINNRVPLTSGSFRAENGGVVATFTAIIPYKSLSSRSSDHTISRIKMYSSSDPERETMLAWVDPPLSSEWVISKDTTNNIAIEWDMTFSNQSTTSAS